MRLGQVVTVKRFIVKNQVGGTSDICEKEVLAKVVKIWGDYEIGERYIGELFRTEDIEVADELGRSDYTPEDYRKYGEKMYQDTLKAYNEYNPRIIYFGQFDL